MNGIFTQRLKVKNMLIGALKDKNRPRLKNFGGRMPKDSYKGFKTYVTGSVSSGFTRGAAETMLVSVLTFFSVAPTGLSFLVFLRELPCFPPSKFLFCTK
jgi:hypothetical protein